MCKTMYSIKMGDLSRIRRCPCLPSKQRAQVLTGREPGTQKWDRRSPIRGHRPLEFWGLVLTADYPLCRTSQAVIPVRSWQLWVSSSALQRKEITYCQWTELAYPDQTYWRPIRPVNLFILGKYKFYQEDLFPGTRDAWMSPHSYHPYCPLNCFQNLWCAKLLLASYRGHWSRLFIVFELLCPTEPPFPFIWITPGLHFNDSCSHLICIPG